MYDVDYFIHKFEQTEEREWCVENFMKGTQKCALGHCGCKEKVGDTKEGLALHSLFKKNGYFSVTLINDGESELFMQKTPKQRVLAALYAIKSKKSVLSN